MPHAPSVGDSQLSSSKRMSCFLSAMPRAARLFKYTSCTSAGEGLRMNVLVEAIGIFPIATVGGPTAGLHEPDAVRLRAQDPQKRFRVHRARPDFHIVGLLQHAALLHPEFREFED